MSGTTRIRIDRLVVHGLAHGTRPQEIEAALRRELAARLTGLQPTESRSVPRVDGHVTSATPAEAASAVARTIGSTAGKRR
ncbi:hypothetical protein AWB71_06085 [Caballeronia peredens]|nr:hypothetical protein AWB71_06085 [Caballeronia peredens]